MRSTLRSIISILVLFMVVSWLGCASQVEITQNIEAPIASIPAPPPPSPTPSIPNLQSEILDKRDKTTTSPIEKVDFRNYTYDLPHGWQTPDGSSITFVNGRIAPISVDVADDMSDEEKAERKAMRRIGLSYVTTKYLDATGDGQDEAAVVLKIETAGAAIPQIVYVFEWKSGEPQLIWPFRTGDRADGGMKDIRAENGELVVELYGQDRFLLGQTETGKITGDEEQLCCPTHFTRSTYKWNGTSFLLLGKRLTFLKADPRSAPLENLGDKVNAPPKSRR